VFHEPQFEFHLDRLNTRLPWATRFIPQTTSAPVTTAAAIVKAGNPKRAINGTASAVRKPPPRMGRRPQRLFSVISAVQDFRKASPLIEPTALLLKGGPHIGPDI
jgi:hypothetical protein